jgi:hypothetical protein
MYLKGLYYGLKIFQGEEKNEFLHMKMGGKSGIKV